MSGSSGSERPSDGVPAYVGVLFHHFAFIEILKGSIVIPSLENRPAVVIYVLRSSCIILRCPAVSCGFQAYRGFKIPKTDIHGRR